jgi:hypothetical protein
MDGAFGGVGEGRRTSLRQIDKFSQIRATPGWTPPERRSQNSRQPTRLTSV